MKKAAPQTPQYPRTHGGWSCGKFPPLRQVPQFWEGTEEFRWTRRGSRFREVPSAGLISRPPPWTWYGRSPSETGAPLCCFGVRQEVLPACHGEGLRDVGKGLLGRGTITASWETWDLGLVSDPKSPYLPVPQFPHMQNGIDDGAHLIRVG